MKGHFSPDKWNFEGDLIHLILLNAAQLLFISETPSGTIICFPHSFVIGVSNETTRVNLSPDARRSLQVTCVQVYSPSNDSASEEVTLICIRHEAQNSIMLLIMPDSPLLPTFYAVIHHFIRRIIFKPASIRWMVGTYNDQDMSLRVKITSVICSVQVNEIYFSWQ